MRQRHRSIANAFRHRAPAAPRDARTKPERPPVHPRGWDWRPCELVLGVRRPAKSEDLGR
jgi:hypothetical protein